MTRFMLDFASAKIGLIGCSVVAFARDYLELIFELLFQHRLHRSSAWAECIHSYKSHGAVVPAKAQDKEPFPFWTIRLLCFIVAAFLALRRLSISLTVRFDGLAPHPIKIDPAFQRIYIGGACRERGLIVAKSGRIFQPPNCCSGLLAQILRIIEQKRSIFFNAAQGQKLKSPPPALYFGAFRFQFSQVRAGGFLWCEGDYNRGRRPNFGSPKQKVYGVSWCLLINASGVISDRVVACFVLPYDLTGPRRAAAHDADCEPD